MKREKNGRCVMISEQTVPGLKSRIDLTLLRIINEVKLKQLNGQLTQGEADECIKSAKRIRDLLVWREGRKT
jgi:hypothetical protein